jgi:hypothetical protein
MRAQLAQLPIAAAISGLSKLKCGKLRIAARH